MGSMDDFFDLESAGEHIYIGLEYCGLLPISFGFCPWLSLLLYPSH